ncbi:hypothetical protein HNY73_009240 [Argiope bruennichi]|uniref:Uncharacterized protein n=1 Tax=Argiope bruennichi TaxID=94029 RepID=A0A8T0F8X5_ARGBR|nr:hypothetical protein HNY73_009240 [Argiope bruennichi]
MAIFVKAYDSTPHQALTRQIQRLQDSIEEDGRHLNRERMELFVTRRVISKVIKIRRLQIGEKFCDMGLKKGMLQKFN